MSAKLHAINPQRPSVLFLLQEALQDVENIKALMIVGVTKDGTPMTARSEMTCATMCYLLKALERDVDTELDVE